MSHQPAGPHAQIDAALHDECAARDGLANACSDRRSEPPEGAHAPSIGTLTATLPALAWLAAFGARPTPAAPGRAHHEQLGRVVVTTCGPGVPLLANGVTLGPGPLTVVDPRLPPLKGGPGAVHRLGHELSKPVGDEPGEVAEAVLSHLEIGDRPRARDGVWRLLAALSDHDLPALAKAAEALTGHGPGLTPEGDDVLQGVALAVTILGPATGVGVDRARRVTQALVVPDLDRRTTALSATLLRLAAIGAAPEPVRRMIEGESAARREVEGLGASSGKALIQGLGAGALSLARGTDLSSRGRPPRERDPARSAASRSEPRR